MTASVKSATPSTVRRLTLRVSQPPSRKSAFSPGSSSSISAPLVVLWLPYRSRRRTASRCRSSLCALWWWAYGCGSEGRYAKTRACGGPPSTVSERRDVPEASPSELASIAYTPDTRMVHASGWPRVGLL